MLGRILLIALGPAISLGCSKEVYTEASMCGGRPAGWSSPADGIGHAMPLLAISLSMQRATVKLGRVEVAYWPDRDVTDNDLAPIIRRAKRLNPQPGYALSVDEGVTCDRVRKVRKMMDDTLGCTVHAACGEGKGW